MPKLVIGNNVTSQGVTNLVALGVSDRDFTSEDEGKIFLGESVEIDENGILQGPVSPAYATVSSGFATTAQEQNYFIDCTAGAILGTITNDLNEYTFTKVDATVNTTTLTPLSGLINGAANYTLSTQRQTITVKWDGTNWYFPPAGAGTGDLLAANNLVDVSNPTIALLNLGGATASDLVNVETELDALTDTVSELSDSVETISNTVTEISDSLTDFASLDMAEQNRFLIKRLITHIAMRGFPISDPLLLNEIL